MGAVAYANNYKVVRTETAPRDPYA